MAKEELKGPEVCKDPVRLTSYAVGVNIYKQGEDPKIKPSEEYPEWWVHMSLSSAQFRYDFDQGSTWKKNVWHFAILVFLLIKLFRP